MATAQNQSAVFVAARKAPKPDKATALRQLIDKFTEDLHSGAPLLAQELRNRLAAHDRNHP